MSLNFKLQSAASRSQTRNIDHELKRIEANEFKEMLNIIQVTSLRVRVHDLLTPDFVLQPYLPQIYVETDADATKCYLFFQRMASKTDLINIITAQAHNLPESLNGSVSETLVGVCEVPFVCLCMPSEMWSLIMRLDAGGNRSALDALQTFHGHPSLLRCRVLHKHRQTF